ncbi:Zinc finger C2HC domain-containing protein 1A [Geranomyces variabilis]|nr:Zinc finger C2HC domain-containing protein 1A [Geranomyces variabilis]
MTSRDSLDSGGSATDYDLTRKPAVHAQSAPSSASKAARLCHICGTMYSKASLPAHQRSCLRKSVRTGDQKNRNGPAFSAAADGRGTYYPCSSCMENIPQQKLSDHHRTCRGIERSATATDARHAVTTTTRYPTDSSRVRAQLDRAVELNRLNQAAQRRSTAVEWGGGGDYTPHHHQLNISRAAEAAEHAAAAVVLPTRSRFVPKKTVLSQPAGVTALSHASSAIALVDEPEAYADDEFEVHHEVVEDEFPWQDAASSAPQPPVYSAPAAAPKKHRQQVAQPQWDDGTFDPAEQPPVADADDRHPCPTCGRKFLELDRLDKHAIACSKMQKPRKVFDIIKARVKGTELEQYASKIRENAMTDEQHGRSKTATQKTNTINNNSHDSAPIKPRPANWRVKHDKFIQMVRAARQPAGSGGSAGGGGGAAHILSEPDPDFVQCEYCTRRFQKDTAARHIPFCKESQQKKLYRTTATRPVPGAAANGALSREEMVKKRVAYKPPTPRTKPKQ